MFDGYEEGVVGSKETKLALPETYYRRLSDSFVHDQNNVGRFFSDPRVVWEATSTINNDGSLYIIKNLCTVAVKMNEVRDKQFSDRFDEIRKEAYEKVKDLYLSNDDSKKLEKHHKRSIDVLCEFDSNNDNSFFGRFIDMLQISEKESYEVVHEIIESPELVAVVNSFDPYEPILKRLPECHSEEEVLTAFTEVYKKSSVDESRQYLESKGIDIKYLIAGRSVSKRKNSYVISESLLNYWKSKLSSSSFLSKTTAGSRFDVGVMSDLINNLIEMIDVSSLVNTMSDSIADTVNVVAIGTANEFFVADILRHKLNTFVTDFGISLLSREEQDKLNSVVDNYNFPISGYTTPLEKTQFSEDELTTFFSDLAANSEGMTPSYDRHYNQWLEYMYMAYIATAGQITIIPNPVANEKIGAIIRSINEEL